MKYNSWVYLRTDLLLTTDHRRLTRCVVTFSFTRLKRKGRLFTQGTRLGIQRIIDSP